MSANERPQGEVRVANHRFADVVNHSSYGRILVTEGIRRQRLELAI